MSYLEIIRRLSKPLSPMATRIEASVEPLSNIRAVLFDVYGTLLVSASGDISLASGVNRGDSAAAALEAVGIQLSGTGNAVVEVLQTTIARHHSTSEFEFPEVDIREVWDETLAELTAAGLISPPAVQIEAERLAIEYEMRVNPVWPMPGMLDCLESIHAAGLDLGIVSNAQVFTKLLFPAIVGKNLDELGFVAELCTWSYEHRQAKPSTYLYRLAATALDRRGITPEQVLYVGNDMRNDVAPASQVGFRAALFAGDARSLRERTGDPNVAGVRADRIVTELPQILTILQLASL